jgi:hypothetical protein
MLILNLPLDIVAKIVLYMIKYRREGDIIRQKRIWYPGATYHAMAITFGSGTINFSCKSAFPLKNFSHTKKTP